MTLVLIKKLPIRINWCLLSQFWGHCATSKHQNFATKFLWGSFWCNGNFWESQTYENVYFKIWPQIRYTVVTILRWLAGVQLFWEQVACCIGLRKSNVVMQQFSVAIFRSSFILWCSNIALKLNLSPGFLVQWTLFWTKGLEFRKVCNFLRYMIEHYNFSVPGNPLLNKFFFLINSIFCLSLFLVHVIRECSVYAIRLLYFVCEGKIYWQDISGLSAHTGLKTIFSSFHQMS